MVRAPCCEKMGLKKGPWSPEEDEILISFIDKHGHGNWRALPKQAGLLRCGKSCRLRWTNYLRPDIKRGNFTQDEEEAIIKLHEMLGNRWSAIAARLPGRTDNEIKNVWHTNMKKKLKNYQPLQTSKRQISRVPRNNLKENKSMATIVPGNDNVGLRGDRVSPERSSSELSSVTDASARNGHPNGEEIYHDEMNSLEYQPQIDESFWSEQSSGDISSSGKESAYVNPLANYDLLLVKQEEMDSSKFIRHKEYGVREQASPPDESLIERDLQGLKGEPAFEFPSSSIVECDNISSEKSEDDMDFWFNIFIKAEDLPDLPEF